MPRIAPTVLALILACSGAAAAESVAEPSVVAPTDPRLGDTDQSAAAIGLEDLLGMPVLGPDDERIGRVDDVLVDGDGQPAELVVSEAGGRRARIEASRLHLAGPDALRLGRR